MQRNIIIGALFLVAVLLIGLSQLTSSREAPAVTPPLRPSPAEQFRGIALQLHNGDEAHPYETFIDEIAQTGANTICFVIHGYQENASSEAILPDARKTPSDRRLGELIDHAHKKELRVALMPVILLAKRRGSEWRGKIGPDNWDEWWKDYRKFLLNYAHIAEKHDVELFSVGSELISTERQTERWRDLIAQVRKAYGGRLTYSANWDHYSVPQWWNDLDIVGMTTYYTLAKGEGASLDTLVGGWQKPKKEILDWLKKVKRPVLFTEVGWPNQATAAEFPWNYYKAQDRPDPELQKRCFESFFRAWADEPAMAGYMVWEWRNYPGQKTDPKSDSSYCPHGKPAMDVIRRHFQRPQATSNPTTQPKE